MTSSKYQRYLDNILEYLALDYGDRDALVAAINAHEPDGRLAYDAGAERFTLGMASWEADRVIESMQAIRDAVMAALDRVVADGVIGEAELAGIHKVRHDLVIQHVYDPDSPTRLNLNYIIPDGKIAWETGLCPHCGEDVTIHLFPDPIPLISYEALINTLRLLTRSIKLKRADAGGYALADR